MSGVWRGFLIALGLVAGLGFALSGSSRRVSRLPAPDELDAPVILLAERYPDFARVFPEHAPPDQMTMAYADEFVAAWGPPDDRELSWWNLWPGNWPFFPQHLWPWNLSGKTIECRIDHPYYEGWKKTVCNCRMVE